MKHDISKSQIVDEFAKSGRFSVVGYNRETGRRCGTYAGLNLHAAFAETVRRVNAGQFALVFSYPTRDDMKNYEDARQSSDLATLDDLRLGRR